MSNNKKKLIGSTCAISTILVVGAYTLYNHSHNDNNNHSHNHSHNHNDNNEKINYKDKESNIVVAEITEDGYAIIHDDHTHLEKGIIPYNAKFLDSVVFKDENYNLKDEEILYEVAQGYIVKIDNKYYYYPKKNITQTNIITKEEAEKITKNNSHSESEHTNNNAGIAGINFPTSDGFLLTSESQIIGRTNNGIIVNHNGHNHILFFDDLAKTHWSYLISKSSNINIINNINKNDDHDHHTFNPNDIVSEDENGYTVRHNDHYHYIPKTKENSHSHIKKDNNHSENNNTIINTNNKNEINNILNNLNFAGIDFPTSDGFLFNGKNIKTYTKNMLIVDHNGHDHVVFYKEIINSKWKKLIPNEYIQKAKEDYNKYLINITNKINEVATKENININSIQIVDTLEGKKIVFYKNNKKIELLLENIVIKNEEHNYNEHDGHSHEEDDHHSEEIENDNFKLGNDVTLTELEKTRVKEILSKYSKDGVTIEKIKIYSKDNMIVYPHMAHYHSEAIDITKEITGVRPDRYEEPKSNPNIETEKIIGPISLNNREELYNKKLILKNNITIKNKIKDINNFRIIAFYVADLKNENINSTLKLNNKNVKYVIYLVRKDLNWNEINITYPEINLENGYFIKGWSHELPKNGQVTDRHFYLNVRPDKYKNSPLLIGPYAQGLEIPTITTPYHISDYARISYQTFNNLGQFELNGKILNNITYYAKNTATWKEILEAGLTIPTPIAKNGYEFTGWSENINKNDKIITTIFIPNFATTDKLLGTYRLNSIESLKNPYANGILAPNNNQKPYDKNKYVIVSFTVDNEKGTTFAYLVRKNNTYKDLGIKVSPLNKKGYKFIGWSDNFNENNYVEEKNYTPIFEKITEENNNNTNPFDDLLGNTENDTNEIEENKKIEYLAKQLGINKNEISVTEISGKKALVYPHYDHKHIIMLDDIDLTKPITNPHHNENEKYEELKKLGLTDEEINKLLNGKPINIDYGNPEENKNLKYTRLIKNLLANMKEKITKIQNEKEKELFKEDIKSLEIDANNQNIDKEQLYYYIKEINNDIDNELNKNKNNDNNNETSLINNNENLDKEIQNIINYINENKLHIKEDNPTLKISLLNEFYSLENSFEQNSKDKNKILKDLKILKEKINKNLKDVSERTIPNPDNDLGSGW